MNREAIAHYEAALKEAFPRGATGEVFHHWNEARYLIATEALDKMAENARELGLDYDVKSDHRLMDMPAQQEQGDSACQEDDGCPTELAVLQRFWRGQSIPYEHYPTWCKPAPVPEAHEQEPVAWQVMVEDCAMKEFSTKDAADEWCVREKLSGSSYAYWIRPLYTRPQAREWVGLTDEELETMAEKYVTNCYFDTLEYARAIEAAHGIKENT